MNWGYGLIFDFLKEISYEFNWKATALSWTSSMWQHSEAYQDIINWHIKSPPHVGYLW